MNYKNLFLILLINNLLLIALAFTAFTIYKNNQRSSELVVTPPTLVTPIPTLVPTLIPASNSTSSAEKATAFSLCSQALALPFTATASAQPADFMYFSQKAAITDNKVTSTLFCTKNDSTIDLYSLKSSVEQELDFNKIYKEKPSYKVTDTNLFVLFSDILDINKLIK